MGPFVESKLQHLSQVRITVSEGRIALLKLPDEPLLPLPLSRVPGLETLPYAAAIWDRNNEVLLGHASDFQPTHDKCSGPSLKRLAM